METPAHLEKMGRELKCPICLSLLNSAASLNCNHVFCNSCIVQSMKSGSNCPVCKMPYRRREIRPAPHMDNLVSIYKSMEAASGINMFVTQNAASAKSSDGKQQAEDNCSYDEQDMHELCEVRLEKKRTLRGKGLRKTDSNQKESGSISVKPSFPTKKRVQVPRCCPQETPACPKQVEGELTDKSSKESLKALKEDKALNKEGELALSPFFWLRDKDVENLSQQTYGDQVSDIPSPNVPTFSDIKDSDDEICAPLGEEHGKSPNVTDLFESEMFDWTQRSCSPELFPSPSKMQIADSNENDGIVRELISQNKNLDEEHSAKSEMFRSSGQNSGNMYGLLDLPLAGTDDSNDQDVSNESNTQGRKVRNIAKRKCTTSLTDPAVCFSANSKRSAYFYKGQVCKNTGSLAKTRKLGKKEHPSEVVKVPTSENFHDLSTGAETQINGDVKELSELPTSLGKSKGSEAPPGNKAGKLLKEINAKKQMDRPVRLRKQKMVLVADKMLEEASEIQKQANKDIKFQLSPTKPPTDGNKKTSGLRNKSRILANDQELKSNKKAKVSSIESSKDDSLVKIRVGNGNVDENGNQPTEKIKGNRNVIIDQSPVQKLPSLTSGVVLQRCEAIPSKNQCAFCLSSEESEASGEIVHYYNGKPVAADHNGGIKIIHAHRTCTEWAPNVYFDDDAAVNLEAELTRSRRIKCSCCESKGAALGCYEKSCHKSFHVTCAKLMAQCRWDTDNFVMLCPLHASSQLPNETSKPQARKKSKQSNAKHHKVTAKQDSVANPDQNFCGSSKKLVLCCSSLTNAERESVSGFERLSGLTVLKNWDSSVTHVIASIDENGACRRTLKVLMGILEGKWILSMKWLNACTEAMKLVNEEPYEINVDIYGIKDGPRLGRLRIQNKQPKIFEEFKFYLMGDFIPSYKGYLQDLVIAAGGTILHRRPVPDVQKVLSANSPKSQTFIIYSLEQPDQSHPSKKCTINGRQDVKALAKSAGATVVSNLWVLSSIAACRLQNLAE